MLRGYSIPGFFLLHHHTPHHPLIASGDLKQVKPFGIMQKVESMFVLTANAAKRFFIDPFTKNIHDANCDIALVYH